MKKIVHVLISEHWSEGYSYQHNNLARKQKELGLGVYVITTQMQVDIDGKIHFQEPKSYVNDYGVKVNVLPCTSHNTKRFVLFDKCKGLYEALCLIKPDIIFLHDFKTRDIRYVIRYKKEHPETKLFVDCHNDYFNRPINSLLVKFVSLVIRLRARFLFALSEKIWGTLPWRMDYLKEVYHAPTEKVDLLIMGADEQIIQGINRDDVRREIMKQYDIPADAFIVATGGKLDKRKQQVLLCEAVKRLEAENIYLLLFGTPTQEMKPQFDLYSECPNIKMLGWADSRKCYEILMAADLAFFPGTHSILWEQAVACGTPAVFRFWDRIQHVNINGNAILQKEVNVDSISSILQELHFTDQYYSLKKKAVSAAPSFYLKNIALKSIGMLP
ncbi:MAG: hypothetical protein J5661_05340 [Bacteroidaceae bacterium]|nr:hypothetical protein [Bacteroidaceae bacterium]